MMESSSGSTRLSQPDCCFCGLLRPRVARDAIEDAIHKSRLVGREEGLRDVDIFVDGDARRDIAARKELEHAAAKDRAERQVDAGQRPGRRQRGMDDRIDLPLPFDYARNDRAEEIDVGRQKLFAFQLRAEPVRLELGDHRGKRRATHIHLIERLHRAEAGCAALIGRAGALPSSRPLVWQALL